MDIMRSRAAHDGSYLAIGTFLVHADKPITPMQPKIQKALRKDIFTPLKLETMFDPPSSQETQVPTPEQSLNSSSSKRIDATPERSVPFLFNGRDSSNAFPFTFSVRRSLRPDPVQHNYTDPQADKSRLRLFQFHYDTFTREHLSALVDAIPISSDSLSASSASIHDGIDSPSSLSHYRPAKRIKLSPPDQLPRARRRHRLSLPRNAPTSGRKDNIRESKSLVQTIADTCSSSSPLSSTPPPAHKLLECEENGKAVGKNVGLEAPGKPKDVEHSSLGFRRQAADSMAQRRRDTQRNISPLSITAEISALSIGTNPPLQPFERRRTLIPVPHMLVGTSSPHVQRKHALREDKVGFGLGSTFHPVHRTAHLAAGVTPNGHWSSTNARSCPSVLPYSSQAQASTSTQGFSQPISTPVSTALPTASCLKHPEWPVAVGVTGSADPNSHHVNLASSGGVQITQITPKDVPELLERVGDMVFNRRKMVWTKETNQDLNQTSDDPFWDFESLVDEDSDRAASPKPSLEAGAKVLAHLASEDSTLSATQGHDSRKKRTVGETPIFRDHITDDGLQPGAGVTQELPERQSSASPPPEKDWTINLIRNATADDQYIHPGLSSNPAKGPLPTQLRSALKPGTPASSETTPHPFVFNRTAGVGPRRSVSFSDGRTSGRIRGLHDSQTEESHSSQSLQPFPDVSMPVHVKEIPVNDPSELYETSARADRIAEMLECLEGDSVGTCPFLFWAKESSLMGDRFVAVKSLVHSSRHKSNARPGQTR